MLLNGLPVSPILILAIGRLLRYLSSIGMTKEAGKDTFTATNVTKALASPGNQAGVIHWSVVPLFDKFRSTNF